MWHRCSICQKQLLEQSNWDSSCVTTYCLFECVVMACNSAAVVALTALVAVDLVRSWLPIQTKPCDLFFFFFWLKHPFVLPQQKAS